METEAEKQESVEVALHTPGQPLADAVRIEWEPRFGHDFSKVRVHTDTPATEAAAALGSRAFTVGRDIVFGAGEWVPHTDKGRRLLAHELSHVVQQRSVSSVSPNAPLESSPVEPAERLADGIASGHSPAWSLAVEPATRLPAARIQRSPMQPGPARSRVSSLETKVADQGTDLERLKKQARAMNQFDGFAYEFLGKLDGCRLAAFRVGTAFVRAAEKHRAALAKRAAIQAASEQAMFSVLTLATTGALSWISEVHKLKDVISQTAEDVLQAGAGELFSAMGPALVQTSARPINEPVGLDPQVYQNDMLILVEDQTRQAREFFGGVKREWEAAPDGFWDSFDLNKQSARYREWSARFSKLVGSTKLPDDTTMAEELERGMWMKWAQGLIQIMEPRAGARELWGGEKLVPWHESRFGKEHPKVNVYGTAPSMMVSFIPPGSPVEERLKKLGIAEDAGIGDFGWFTSRAEITQLYLWALRYKVKPFVP